MSVTFGTLSSLQSTLQSLSPLTSCLASILNSRRCVKSVPKSNGLPEKQATNETHNREIFHSVLEEVKQVFCDKRFTNDKSYELIVKNLTDFKCDQKLVKMLTIRILNSKRDPLSHWTTSHSSQWTFDDNKYRPDRHKQIRLFSNWMSSVSAINYCQSRSFKNRSTYTGIGSSGGSNRSKDETSLGHKKLGSIFNIKKDKNPIFENEKIREYINEEHLNSEEKDRIKIAFAEGYMAAEPRTRTSSKMKFFNIFRDLMGIVLIIAILFSFMGGSFRRVLIGGSNEVHPEDIDVTFDDVKGIEEAKQELQEIVEFLKDPEKFSVLGGKLPKGVLLVGPPGTGKTLLARAVAGEAGVPFFHAAGPEFDEILVGQGARRVRDLFSTAKLKAPCVVFIDEIDSVGAKRSNSVLHPYANQTINQLLTEMDGFRQNEGVIVLGATNRRDDLDKALLRPGRFDVEVQVPVPDFHGRKEILELYLSKVKYSNDVNIDVLSRGTTGFTGADIENMVNQAALRAAIDGQTAVNMKYLENSRDKVLMGPERKSRIPDEEANIITAYHEGGHALVAHFTKDAAPLHKVTIVPRGPSLGHTAYLPEKERFYTTKSQMMAQLDTAMGGRAAEELVFGTDKITTGAYDDLRTATNMATHMVKNLGMSDKIGVRTFEEDHNSLVVVNDLAASTAEMIDSEIKRILQDSYERAKAILKAHHKEHKLLAEALLKYETLNAEEVKNIISKTFYYKAMKSQRELSKRTKEFKANKAMKALKGFAFQTNNELKE